MNGRPGAAALLGIDLGTSAVKVIVLAADGQVQAAASASYPVHSPYPGWAESDPPDWWDAVGTAAARALGDAPQARVLGIGVAGQMHGVVLADRSGAPVRPAALWADTRACEEADRFRELPEDLLASLANPIAPGMAGPLLLWFARHESLALDRAAWAFQPKDWLRFQLTGHAASDPTDASATLLYDVLTDRWAPEVLDALGQPSAPPALLPPLRESWLRAGSLTAAAARHLGLPAGLPVAAGAADTAAAALGGGLIDPGPMQITIGTGAQLIVPRDKVPADLRRITHTYRAAAPMRWYSMAAIQNAGLALEWVIRTLRADWEAAYGSLDAVPPGADGLVFLPYLTGERTPHLNPRLSASWAGMRLHHGREHLLRAALEGVAFSIRDAAQALAATGADIRGPRLAGGGSTHQKWRQLLADVLGEELYEVASSSASARGAAMLGGVAAGTFPDVRAASELAPPPVLAATPHDASAYDAPYQRFRAAASNSLTRPCP